MRNHSPQSEPTTAEVLSCLNQDNGYLFPGERRFANPPLIPVLFNGHPGTSQSGVFYDLSAAIDET